MKTAQLSTLTLFFLGMLLFVPDSNPQAYNTWSLPDGAKARLGKGWINGQIAYFPDGKRLAVTGSIGTWIYDVDTGTALDLLIGVLSLALSPDGTMVASIAQGSEGRDSVIEVWDVATRQPLSLIHI